MKKLSSILLLIMVLAVLLTVPAMAASPLLEDGAGLLTAEENARLSGYLQEITDSHGVSIIVFTLNSLEGNSPEAVAEYIADNGAYGSDTMLLLISMQEGYWYIDAMGRGVDALRVRSTDSMGEEILPYLASGDFYGGFTKFAMLCDSQLTGDVMSTGPQRMGIAARAILSLAIGLVAALIATGVMKGKLRSVRPQGSAGDYAVRNSFDLTQSRDLFLYSQVTRRPRPQQQSRSPVSTHISAGGNSHSGGGGRF